MPNELKDFYLNEVMRETVKAYLVKVLTERAVQKVFDRQDTSGVAEAKECIDGAFSQLEVLFAKKAESKEIKNEAR